MNNKQKILEAVAVFKINRLLLREDATTRDSIRQAEGDPDEYERIKATKGKARSNSSPEAHRAANAKNMRVKRGIGKGVGSKGNPANLTKEIHKGEKPMPLNPKGNGPKSKSIKGPRALRGKTINTSRGNDKIISAKVHGMEKEHSSLLSKLKEK